ncbi:MAG: hypothetical protein WC082_15080 [Victivallales bacterium]
MMAIEREFQKIDTVFTLLGQYSGVAHLELIGETQASQALVDSAYRARQKILVKLIEATKRLGDSTTCTTGPSIPGA